MPYSTCINYLIMAASLGVAGLAGIGTGEVILPEKFASQAPLPIEPVSIEIRADGSVHYDRRVNVRPGVDAHWSVAIAKRDGRAHCSGGGRFPYPYGPPQRDPDSWHVDDFVGDDCSGLEEGMTYHITWTPVNPNLSPSHWPPEGEGVGRVLPAKKPEQETN